MKLFALALAAYLTAVAAGPPVDKGKAMGSPSAPVLMELFSSFDCPHCKVLHETVIPSLVKDYVVPGKVYLVNRDFPLSGPPHPYAREAALYATAAARIGKYAQVQEALFANQATWATNGKVWETVASVLSPPDQKRVQALAKEPDVAAEVQREYDEGIAAGITGTPTIIVTRGSRRYPIPAQDLNYGFLKSLLDGMLK